jgi:aminoglycoside phosphotransferase (APT) family kinase protein
MDTMVDAVRLLARSYGVTADQVREVPGGVANRAFVLGERLFVRVARPGFEEDLRKETVVVPVAREAGVRTPAILEYDPSDTQLGAPYVVVDRVHGNEPEITPGEVLVDLARLHTVRRGTLAEVPVDGWGEPRVVVGELADRGYLDAETARWLAGWFTRLEQRFDRSAPAVLVHGDVAPHNLLVGRDNSLQAVIDWGDAAWGPRALDFAKLRLTEVVQLLPEYLSVTRELSDSTLAEDELAAGVLYLHLSWGLGKLQADPWPGQRHWTAPPASRLLNLLAFFTTNPPHPWHTLT